MRDEEVALSVEWLPGGEAVAERLEFAHRMMSLALAPDGRTDLSGDGDRCRLTMHFRQVA